MKTHTLWKTLLSISAASMLTVPNLASAATTTTPPAISISIDGQAQHYDVMPYIKNGRTLVPLSGIMKALGAQVIWTPDKPNLVKAIKGNTTITLTINQNTAYINGQQVTLDQASELKNNRTMVPLRFISEAMGSDVTWVQQTYSVNILSNVFPVGQLTNRQDLHLAYYHDFTTFDSAKAASASDLDVLGQVEEGLVRIDANGQPIPGVASSWTVSPDGKTYTFTLRSSAKWSDGSSVTAQDFEYAWKRALNPQVKAPDEYELEELQGGAAFNQGIGTADQVGVKALDNQTLQVTLTDRMPYFLSQTALPVFYPLKQSYVEQQGSAYGTNTNHTLYDGPFELRQWVNGMYAALSQNLYYWDKSHVKLNKIVYDMAFYSNTAESWYQKEEEQHFFVSNTQYDRLKTAPDFHRQSLLETGYLAFNTKETALQNVNIRKALTYAIDPNVLIEKYYNDGFVPATGMVPFGTFDGNGGDFRTETGDLLDRQDNAAKAKMYLQQGLSQLGLTALPRLSLSVDNNTFGTNMGNFMQSQWSANLGINVKVNAISFADRMQAENNHSFDITYDLWSADYNDPMTFLNLFTTNQENNDPGYSNTAYDQLITAAQNESNPAQRLQDMEKAEQQLMQDMPVGPLVFGGLGHMTKPNVKGWIDLPMGPNYDLKNVYLTGSN